MTFKIKKSSLALVIFVLVVIIGMLWFHGEALREKILTDYGIEPYEIQSPCEETGDPTQRKATTFGL